MVHFYNSSLLFFSFLFDWFLLGTTWRLVPDVVKDVSCVLTAWVVFLVNTLYMIQWNIYLFTASVFVNMKISLSAVSRHLETKIHLQKIHRIFWLFPGYSSHLTWNKQFLYEFWFIFHRNILKVPHDAAKNNSFKRWIIFLKNYHSHPEGHQYELKWP